MARAELTDTRLVAEVVRGLAESNLSPHYRHEAMKRGFVKILTARTPGQRGKSKYVAIMTTKGERFWDKHKVEVMSEMRVVEPKAA